jgi:hypothetical protein
MNMELGYIDDEDSGIIDHPPVQIEKSFNEKKGFFRKTKKKSDKIQASSSKQVSRRTSIDINHPSDESLSSTTPQSMIIFNEEKHIERKGTGSKFEQPESKNNAKGDEIKKSAEINSSSEDHSNPECPSSKHSRKASDKQTIVSSEIDLPDDKIRNTFSTNSDLRPAFEENSKLSNSLVMMRQKEIKKMKSKEYKSSKACVKCLIF